MRLNRKILISALVLIMLFQVCMPLFYCYATDEITEEIVENVLNDIRYDQNGHNRILKKFTWSYTAHKVYGIAGMFGMLGTLNS